MVVLDSYPQQQMYCFKKIKRELYQLDKNDIGTTYAV
jgi:hypothetical protein